MPSVKTRLEQLEKARSADIRCVWLYVGWGRRGCPTDGGDGVSRVFVPVRPAALAPGLMAVLRHPGGAEVSAAAAAWALAPLALSPRQRSLVARARILVLITAGGSGPPSAAANGPPPAAEGPPPPAAERPPPPAAEGPLPPPETQWPEWLPR
jgi:hypothetical protein